MQKHKKEGIKAYKSKKVGRPKLPVNPAFVKKVIEIRKSEDYGSEKIHFVTTQEGYGGNQGTNENFLWLVFAL